MHTRKRKQRNQKQKADMKKQVKHSRRLRAQRGSMEGKAEIRGGDGTGSEARTDQGIRRSQSNRTGRTQREKEGGREGERDKIGEGRVYRKTRSFPIRPSTSFLRHTKNKTATKYIKGCTRYIDTTSCENAQGRTRAWALALSFVGSMRMSVCACECTHMYGTGWP